MKILGIVEFHELARGFLGVLHEVLLVVVLCEGDIPYLLVHNNLLHNRYLVEVVRKLPPILHEVVLHSRYLSDILHFYFGILVFEIYILYI